MWRRERKPTQTQREIEDMAALLADVPMDPYVRHLIDEHLRDLKADADAGALCEEKAQELEDIESEIDDIAMRIRARGY